MYGHVASMVVEPTFLARVSSATFDQPGMQKLVRRAHGTHALFHVRSRHGVEVVLRGTGDAARLVVPAVRVSPASEPCTISLHYAGPYAVERYTYT